MPSTGIGHTCFLCKDGQVIAFGFNSNGECNVPVLPEGLTYAQAAAGGTFTLLLRSDGVAMTCGGKGTDRVPIPKNEREVTYTQGAAGLRHWVLLRSDGRAVAGISGDSVVYDNAMLVFPSWYDYMQVAAGAGFTVLLTVTGEAIARGQNDCLQCNIPELVEGTRYTYIAAGICSTGLIRSDGKVLVCSNWPAIRDAQNLVPALEEGLTYVELAMGYEHLVLLRSDGMAFAVGSNDRQQCDIPVLEDGVVYTQVAAMCFGTVLLRSDGTVAHAGKLDHEFEPRSDRLDWANIPAPMVNFCFVPMPTRPKELILQLWVRLTPSGDSEAECRNLAGNVVMNEMVTDWSANVLGDIRDQVPSCYKLTVILSDGSRLQDDAPWWHLKGCD